MVEIILLVDKGRGVSVDVERSVSVLGSWLVDGAAAVDDEGDVSNRWAGEDGTVQELTASTVARIRPRRTCRPIRFLDSYAFMRISFSLNTVRMDISRRFTSISNGHELQGNLYR
jgi:hypothetical protein